MISRGAGMKIFMQIAALLIALGFFVPAAPTAAMPSAAPIAEAAACAESDYQAALRQAEQRQIEPLRLFAESCVESPRRGDAIQQAARFLSAAGFRADAQKLLSLLPAPVRPEPALPLSPALAGEILPNDCQPFLDAGFFRAYSTLDRKSLQAYIERCAPESQRTDAYQAAADVLIETGRHAEALQLLRRVPEAQRRPDPVVARAVAAIRQKKDAGAVGTLLAIDPAGLIAADRALRQDALVETLLARNDVVTALWVTGQSLPLANAEESARLCRLGRPLLERLGDADLFPLADRSMPGLRADLLTEAALRALHRGETVAAQEALTGALATTGFCREAEAVALRDRLEGPGWIRRGVGVVLPLSDRFAPFGEAVRRGMELAIRTYPGGQSVPFFFRDGGSDGETSRRRVAELVGGERVMAIVGPLSGGAALAAAATAEEAQVPLIALASRDGIPGLGDYVFRDALTARQQVDALVRHALQQEKRARFAVLYPENRSGQELADLFAAAVKAQGGTLVARQSYAEETTDFRAPVKLLRGEDPGRPDPIDKESRRKVRPAPPPFDALFIPDLGERVALIAPYLAYYGLDSVQLYGTGAWNSPELFERAGRYVDGAVFSDAFYAGSDTVLVRAFDQAYRDQYGDEPSVLEAEGYDLARLLIDLLQQPEIRDRATLRTALAHLRDYPGVTGRLGFTPAGETRKTPFLLRIRNGGLILEEEADPLSP